MGIDAVHLNGAMTGVQDYTTMKHQEETKGALNQTNYMNQFNHKVENKMTQIQSKENLDNQNKKFDAKEKGSNSYSGDGGEHHNKKEDKTKSEAKAPYLGGSFDMKI